MSTKVSSLPEEEPAYLHGVRPGKDTEFDKNWRQGRIDQYRAWAQFHKAPYIDRVVAPGSVIQFNKYPLFRGLIKVEPPLGPGNELLLERLWNLEEVYSERWIMSKVAETLGIPLEQAIDKYGPQGEFMDPETSAKLQMEHSTTIVYPGGNVPPSSQPVGYCKFHYWEEDADTGRVIREAAPAQEVMAQEEAEAAGNNGAQPKDTVAYLAWNMMEKFHYPVEWLAYLGEQIFKPVGSVLNGELEFFDDYESLGTIKVVNSFVSVPVSYNSDPGHVGDDCECPGCLKALRAEGPLGWEVPKTNSDVLQIPGRDKERLEEELKLFAKLPANPCTWPRAAEKLSCFGGITAPANTVLLALPAAPPIEKVICTGEDMDQEE